MTRNHAVNEMKYDKLRSFEVANERRIASVESTLLYGTGTNGSDGEM